VTEPGIGFKLPIIDEVIRFEDRIMDLQTDLIEVTPSDDRRLEIDAFVLYRIDDILQYRQAIGTGGERRASEELSGILESQIRAVLGSQGVTSNTILSPERSALMDQIRARSDARAKNFDATLQRMIAEREREATDERARGREAAQRVQKSVREASPCAGLFRLAGSDRGKGAGKPAFDFQEWRLCLQTSGNIEVRKSTVPARTVENRVIRHMFDIAVGIRSMQSDPNA